MRIFAGWLWMLVAAIVPTGAPPVLGAEDGQTLTFQSENDRYVVPSTDRHYTNGFKLSWLSRKQTDLPAVLDRLSNLPSVFVESGSKPLTRRIGVSLGHSIFTPEDTESRELVKDDRPYAGWAYVGLSLHAIHADAEGGPARRDTLAIELGVVGPGAGGEDVQNTWHDIIGADRSNGWDNQLKNEPGFNFIFERRWRTAALAPFRPLGLSLDFIPHYSMSLGNVLTAFGAGGTLRIGQELQTDFGPPRIRPSLPGSEGFEYAGALGWYLFVGGEGRLVARNIFLDGNNWRDSPSVASRTLVGDFQFGAALVYENLRLAYTHVVRTEEFVGQPQADRFGALSLSVRF